MAGESAAEVGIYVAGAYGGEAPRCVQWWPFLPTPRSLYSRGVEHVRRSFRLF